MTATLPPPIVERQKAARGIPPFWARLIVIVAILAVWEFAYRIGWLNPLLMSSPINIGASLGQLFQSPKIIGAVGTTAWTVLLSFLIGALFGVVSAAILGRSSLLHKAYFPVVLVGFTTPKMLILPLMILFFGMGEPFMVAYGAVSAYFAVTVMVTAAVQMVNPSYYRVARSLGAGWVTVLVKITIPACIGPVIVAMWYAVKQALTAVLIAELFVGGGAGIGSQIKKYTATFQADNVWALVIFVAALAVIAGGLLRVLEEKVDRTVTSTSSATTSY